MAIFGALQIALGFIHVVLLFTLYRYTLVTACSDSASDKLFWWSLGHVQADEEAQQLIDNCYAQWSRIAAQRTITWVVYSMLLVNTKEHGQKFYENNNEPDIDFHDDIGVSISGILEAFA